MDDIWRKNGKETREGHKCELNSKIKGESDPRKPATYRLCTERSLRNTLYQLCPTTKTWIELRTCVSWLPIMTECFDAGLSLHTGLGIRTNICIDRYMCVWLCMHVYMNIYIYTYLPTNIHIHTYIYIYICTPKWMVCNGKSYKNGWFGGTTMETPI